MRQNDRPTEPINGSAGNWNETERFNPGDIPSQRTQRVDGYEIFGTSPNSTQILSAPPPVLAWVAIAEGSGAHVGSLYQLTNPQGMNIGRDGQSNDIVLDDPAVSRQHAKIRLEEGTRKREPQFYIYDLASANGTFVNGRKIQRQLLKDGDQIRVGETTLVFKTVGKGPAEKKPAKKRTKRPSKSANEQSK